MNTLVLGLGNLLLGDDGAGVHAIQKLQQDFPAFNGATFLDGGTLSFTLVGYIEESDNLIILDAAQLNSPPGTISVFEGENMDRFVTGNRNKSVHEVTITDVLAFAHLNGHLPQRRALVGIQPQRIDWSDSLSEPVVQAIPHVCRITHDLIMRWDNELVSGDSSLMAGIISEKA